MSTGFKLKSFVTMICLGGIMISTVAAQDSIRMNLDKALEIAFSESPTVKIADREITLKKYYEKEQIAALFPTVAISGSYNRTLKKQVMAMSMNNATTKIAIGTDNSWAAGLNLSLPLVAPSLWKTVQLSQMDIELAVEAARSSRIELQNQVKKAYYDVLLSKDSYRVLLISYKNVEMNAQNVTDKYNQGLASEFEKLRADVQVKNAHPNVVAAESAVRLATMQLKVLIGVDVSEPIIFEGSLSDLESQMNQFLTVSSSPMSLENNTNLIQLSMQEGQLEKSIEILRAAYLPTLSLSGSYQYTSLNNDFKIGDYDWNPYAMVGLSLSIPIYNGRSKELKVKQQQLNIENLADNRTNLERQLWLSIDNCLTNMRNAIEDLASNKETIVSAEKAYDISKKQYEVGMATLLELNDTELALTQSRLAYTQSIYNYVSSASELESVLGNSAE